MTTLTEATLNPTNIATLQSILPTMNIEDNFFHLDWMEDRSCLLYWDGTLSMGTNKEMDKELRAKLAEREEFLTRLTRERFDRPDTTGTQDGKAVDKHHPSDAAMAVRYSVPEGFSNEAKRTMEYFDDTAFIYGYKGKLVLTDESRWLTEAGDGSYRNPLGFPRGEFDRWEELEDWLELVYEEREGWE